MYIHQGETCSDSRYVNRESPTQEKAHNRKHRIQPCPNSMASIQVDLFPVPCDMVIAQSAWLNSTYLPP